MFTNEQAADLRKRVRAGEMKSRLGHEYTISRSTLYKNIRAQIRVPRCRSRWHRLAE
jgi:hypothetical protein